MVNIAEIANECLVSSRFPSPHCLIDDGEYNPPWLGEGDVFYWWDERSGSLNIRGMSIPLTTRWILCPKHEHLVKDTLQKK